MLRGIFGTSDKKLTKEGKHFIIRSFINASASS
jgi:hypothetical protein